MAPDAGVPALVQEKGHAAHSGEQERGGRRRRGLLPPGDGITPLVLPSDTRQIPSFLKHSWVFDLPGTTAVDEQRSELYREQSQRNQFRTAAASFSEFINDLQLTVEVTPALSSQYERAAQLTQRTNQFNTSGIRRTSAELAALLSANERSALLVR